MYVCVCCYIFVCLCCIYVVPGMYVCMYVCVVCMLYLVLREGAVEALFVALEVVDLFVEDLALGEGGVELFFQIADLFIALDLQILWEIQNKFKCKLLCYLDTFA